MTRDKRLWVSDPVCFTHTPTPEMPLGAFITWKLEWPDIRCRVFRSRGLAKNFKTCKLEVATAAKGTVSLASPSFHFFSGFPKVYTCQTGSCHWNLLDSVTEQNNIHMVNSQLSEETFQ